MHNFTFVLLVRIGEYLLKSDVRPSVKGQVQPCYIYHGSQNTAKTKRWI